MDKHVAEINAATDKNWIRDPADLNPDPSTQPTFLYYTRLIDILGVKIKMFFLHSQPVYRPGPFLLSFPRTQRQKFDVEIS